MPPQQQQQAQTPDPSVVVKDPEFLKLPDEAKHDVLRSIDSNYASLAPEAQKDVLKSLSIGPGSGAMQKKKGGPIIYGNQAPATQAKLDPQTVAAVEKGMAGTVPGGELTMGAVKGLMSTGRNLGGLATKIPLIGPKIAEAWPEAASGQALEEYKPHGLAQNLGFGGEQIGEFMLPGGLEKAGAEKLATKLPLLGKLAKPASRVLTSALSTGAVNKAQGGDFGTGAATGGLFSGLGEAGKLAAPYLAETALGISNRLRGFGRTPGKAALEEISGVRPGTIAQNASAKAGQLTKELEAKAAAVPQGTTASTNPAIQVIDREQVKAIKQNNQSYYDQLHQVREQLTKEFSTGDPIPRDVHPSQLLDLKRGIGNLESSWNPAQRGNARGTIRQVYSALDKELDKAVPGSNELNQRISSLIPVSQRAANLERGASMGQKVAGRLAAHTGALAGSVGGAMYGREVGGNKGALLGGLLGLAGPEFLASPTTQMGIARGLKYAPDLATLGRKTLFPVERSLDTQASQ